MTLEVKVRISHTKTRASLLFISVSAILLSVPRMIYKSLSRQDCLISIQHINSEDNIVADKRSNSVLSFKAVFRNVFVTNDP